MTARACAEKNLSVRRTHRGDLMHMALGQRSDVLLVDEANSVAESMLQALSLGEGKNPATTTVFLGLPSCVSRFLLSKIHPVIIELTPLPPADARIYLLEQANQARLPDLFTTEALDLIINGSLGRRDCCDRTPAAISVPRPMAHPKSAAMRLRWLAKFHWPPERT
jgi:type II secretory pathway predicted ATPase ExeA